MDKVRVALIGAGGMANASHYPSVTTFRDVEIVGLCDVNPDRVKVAQRWMGGAIPTFTDFDGMIRVTKPEGVIVTTVDATHADYVCRAMELGLDPISEKPLCTHADQAQRIVDVQKRTGRTLDVSMLETMVSWMGIHLEAHRASGGAATAAMPLSGRQPCYGVYRTADGGHVALAALEPLFWRDFCRAVARPDLAGTQFGDEAARARLSAELQALFASRTTTEWADLIREADLSAEVVADLDAVLADPHLTARGTLAPAEPPDAGVVARAAGPPATGSAPPRSRPAPNLAADTRAVLAEMLDLDDAAIDNLLAAGAAFGPERGVRRRVAPAALP